MEFRIISADNHVMEPPGTFVDRVPSSMRNRVPRFMPAADGGEGWTLDGRPPTSSPVPNTMGTGPSGWTWDQIAPGNWQGAAHLEDMAQDGIDGAVMYPGMAGAIYGFNDQEVKLACFRAYNDWLLDDFCAADPKRLVGACMMPVDDPIEHLMAEAERTLKKGARAMYIPMTGKRPLFDPELDRFWALVSGADIVATLHNFGGAAAPIPDLPGVDAMTMRASRIVQSFFQCHMPLSNMIFGGVFERFPKLKFVAAEVNIGWVPFWLQQMHLTIERPHMKGGDWYPSLPNRHPEEYIGKNIFFTVLDDYLGFRFMREDPRLAASAMWSIDYPHAVTLWGRTQQLAGELTAGMDEPTRQNILADTAVRLFNFG